MKHAIRIAGTGIAFECGEDTPVLDAAQDAGWQIPYSCRSGVCLSCRARVVSGEFDGPSQDGEALLCRVRPRGELVIAPREIARIDPAAKKRIRAKVYRITQPADDVTVLQLRFPAGVRVKFRAGQYLNVLLEDGARRSFSMANPPQNSDGVVLHVRHLPGGRFSDGVLPALAAGMTLEVELPEGDFWLRDSEKPIVFVASGTGFAPIRSMVEDAIRRDLARPMTLYWGARRRRDLYEHELPQQWAAARPGFRYIPVLSAPAPEDRWRGRTGFVHRAVLEDFASLADAEVYACGVTAMVEAARRDFVAMRGLPAAAFFCDAFVTPADGGARSG